MFLIENFLGKIKAIYSELQEAHTVHVVMLCPTEISQQTTLTERFLMSPEH